MSAAPEGQDGPAAPVSETAGDVAVEDNSHAGQGSVMIDIGGEIGALVVDAPASMEGVEIEIRPTGDTPYADGARPEDAHRGLLGGAADDSPHDHPHDHPHDPAAGHPHAHDPAARHPYAHDHHHDDAGDGTGAHHGGSVDGHALVHVAVLERPSPSGPRWAAVYPQLHEGTYDLYVRPAEPVALSVTITGGAVTEATWPAPPD